MHTYVCMYVRIPRVTFVGHEFTGVMHRNIHHSKCKSTKEESISVCIYTISLRSFSSFGDAGFDARRGFQHTREEDFSREIVYKNSRMVVANFVSSQRIQLFIRRGEHGCVRIIIADGMNCELRDNLECMMRGNFHANYQVLYASDALINTSIAVFSYRAFKNRQYPEK